ncbi:basic amino acid ABC transporter substrate-binding protein [Aquibacillus salsiterrae]|uniref:Basic amino acid ABC transporter substrate-binding protein n=1 Tax=Aquibacillus salsiterrae TaxID=2950439 RepID=A0A9X3WG96_9BACI|nr:basic amino acid ABC transporter substrate-binding protein [Aquibacillus salsiterrae]MDC3416894.1 basic amino acid ABC transporter substrate-binding protein [Aquibacillus salsiterrae]
MRKLPFLYVSLLLIGILALAGCGTSTDETESDTNGSSETEQGTDGQATEQADEEKKVLQVGTDAAFAPFEFMETGEIVGFDVDLLAAVMEEAGYDYELKNLGWDPMLESVRSGSVDLGISGITINDDRKETYDFSVPYFQSTHMIVFNEGVGITNANDLEGKRIGVQTGTTGADAAEKIVGQNNKNISKYETTALAFMALQNGDVEAVVTDNVVAAEYKKNNPDAKVETVTDEDNFESEFYGIMFPKDSEIVDEISSALATVIENGTYTEIYQEWFGEEPNLDALTNATE